MKAARKEQITTNFSENIINLKVKSWASRGVIRSKSAQEYFFLYTHTHARTIHIYTHIYIIHIYFSIYICISIYINAKSCGPYVASVSVCSPLRNVQLWSSLNEQVLNFFQLHQDQHKCPGSQESQFKSKIASPHPVSLENSEFLHRAFYPGLQTGCCWASPWSPIRR